MIKKFNGVIEFDRIEMIERSKNKELENIKKVIQMAIYFRIASIWPLVTQSSNSAALGFKSALLSIRFFTQTQLIWFNSGLFPSSPARVLLRRSAGIELHHWSKVLPMKVDLRFD